MRYVMFVVLALIPFVNSANEKADKALAVVRSLCLAGDGYEIEADADANIRILKKGIEGSIRFSESNTNGFVDVRDEDKRGELDAIRSCTKPYIPQIIDIIIGPSPTPSKETYLVKVKPFKVRPNQVSGVSLSMYIDGEYIDDINNLRTTSRITIGELEKGTHEFTFENINGYYVDGFGNYQLVPHLTGLECYGEFVVRRNKTYDLQVVVDQFGNLRCGLQ
ncbi:hypothetical protein WMQ59_22550 [Vibrio diabolicus]|uniref:hypothetical protein n=1 Tax=Vibrio diabolicus TaxID=50719 RepID=UPI003750AF1A